MRAVDPLAKSGPGRDLWHCGQDRQRPSLIILRISEDSLLTARPVFLSQGIGTVARPVKKGSALVYISSQVGCAADII
jgi:hypothetical protein